MIKFMLIQFERELRRLKFGSQEGVVDVDDWRNAKADESS